jgi:nitrogen fixation-related uncharacterized protein
MLELIVAVALAAAFVILVTLLIGIPAKEDLDE